MNEKLPQIRRFLDARTYLQAIYNWKKHHIPHFSYSMWAAEFGFKSRSFLRLLLIGKRTITDGSIPILIQGLGLSKSDGEYFEKLVRFNQAKTIELKERYGRELSRSSLATLELSEIQNRLRFVSNPIIPRLQTLLSLQDVSHKTEVLAEILGISISETSMALQTLEDMGLAQVSHFEVKEDLGNLALQAFYRKSFEECTKALDLPVAIRNFQCGLFPLLPAEYDQFVTELNEFIKQALARFGSNSGENRRIYQITAGLIPVSQPILRVEKSRPVPVGFCSEENRPTADKGVSI